MIAEGINQYEMLLSDELLSLFEYTWVKPWFSFLVERPFYQILSLESFFEYTTFRHMFADTSELLLLSNYFSLSLDY